MNNKEAKNMSQKEELVPRWYVVHTYSGYENKVKTDLEKTLRKKVPMLLIRLKEIH